MLTAIRDTVLQLLPAKKKSTASGWTSFNAPCCVHNGESADRRGRGGIIVNPEGAINYHCFNCGYKANYTPGRNLNFRFKRLLSWLGADENTIQHLGIEALRVKELVNPEAVQEEPREEVTFKKRGLPEEAQTFQALSNFYTLNEDCDVPPEFHSAVLYAAQRGLDLSQHDFYWTPETAYNLNRRIIIPFTWKGEVIGYTARGITDDVKPKYHSNYEPDYVYGIDQQRPDSKFVIVCEGPFDALSVGGVAVLSNRISLTQAEIIDDLDREVIVVPDADRAGSALIDAAIEYGWSVSYPVWQRDYKDINAATVALGPLFVLKSILAARVRGRLKIELHRKRLYN